VNKYFQKRGKRGLRQRRRPLGETRKEGKGKRQSRMIEVDKGWSCSKQLGKRENISWGVV